MAILAVYFSLAATTVREVGTVGEVAIGWMARPPPVVLAQLDPPLPADLGPGHRWGPLVASQSRPTERLAISDGFLPLTINDYTGGLPDWPARLVHRLTGSVLLVTALHVLWGAGILWMVYAFLNRHGSRAAAIAGTLVLACRWDFVFYRKVLGGTELVLLAATIAALWAVWDRRWSTGRWGIAGLAWAICAGMHAKLTFAVVAAALVATTLLLRWDRAALRPPTAPRRWWAVALATTLWLPHVLSWTHQAALPTSPRIQSHDHATLQLQRVWTALSGGPTPTREGLENLWSWLIDPLSFLARAYGVATPPPAPVWMMVLGALVTTAGIAQVWAQRHATPRDALLRFVSVFALIATVGLFFVARDLHHLAMVAPLVAIVTGLAADQVAGFVRPTRSRGRVWASLVFVAPMCAASVYMLRQTDVLVEQIAVPTFTAKGQAALAALLDRPDVSRVVVCDYESMGALELALADRGAFPEVVHAWGAASQRTHTPGLSATFAADLLRFAAGDHVLTVRASAPMIYNLRTRGRAWSEAAARAGVRVELVGELDDNAQLWAVHPAAP